MLNILLTSAPSSEVAAVAAEVTEQVNEELSFFQRFIADVKDDLFTFSFKVFFALLFLIIGTIIIKFILRAVHKAFVKASEKSGFTHVNFLDQTVKVILYAILIAIIAQYFGISATSVVALLGSAGLTIGLAFQGSLSNFAGGVLLLLHKPFNIGDYVIIGDSTEGVVSEIGIIYTTLIVGDQKTIVIPNGSLSNSTLVNLTPNGTRFLEIVIGISYSSDIELAKSLLEDIANNEPLVLKDHSITTFVSSISASSVDIGLRVYTDPSNYINAKWSLLEKSKVAFDENKIEIPFDQIDVHMR